MRFTTAAQRLIDAQLVPYDVGVVTDKVKDWRRAYGKRKKDKKGV